MNPVPAYTNTADYAVVVGVRHYPSFGDLNGPIEDARAFHTWLTDPKKGSVPTTNCQLVESSVSETDPDIPQRPIQALIDSAFRRIWLQLIAEGKRAHRFYFFFSGHGIGVNPTNTALLMANFGQNFFLDSALSSESYLKRIIGSGRFQEVVFLLDCCRNELLGVNGLPPTFNWPADGEAGQTSVLIGYAAEYQNKSFEAAVDNQELKRLSDQQDGSLFRGHFTRALLNGLNGGAADFTTGRITPESLKLYLEKETPQVAQQYKRNQRARVSNDFRSDQEAFFGATPFNTKARFRIDLKPTHTGNVILIMGRGALILKSKDRDLLPWEIILPTDTYMLIDEVTGETQTIEVRPTLQTETIQLLF